MSQSTARGQDLIDPGSEPALEGAPHRPWFESAERQSQASRLGMWLFLTSELLLFAGLFVLYAAYRVEYPREFREAVAHNNLVLGSINTVILITSSFAAAWAVRAIRAARSRVAALSLLSAVTMGAGFLVLKAIEYRQHIRDGALPGIHYTYSALPNHGANLFFTLYWFMTGLHALHVIFGMAALSLAALQTWRGKVRSDYPTLVESSALYWHLVDVVWIFLWPLLYLTH